jgi:hypothetical protein
MKIILLILLLAAAAAAQTKISGVVTNSKNEPLPLANVLIKDSYDGASTDTLGRFSFITDEKGTQTIVVSYIGFKKEEREINLNSEPINLKFVLKEEANQLRSIIISAGSFEASDEKKAVILRPLDIITTAGATADIDGVLKTLPGTQIVGEQEGLFVRGGSASETKTIIDEMIVQNPYFSAVPDIPQRGRFSPFLFKGTIFSTGGYSAKYGQALSSTLILNSQDLIPFTSSNISLMVVGLGGSHSRSWENSSALAAADYVNTRAYSKLLNDKTDWIDFPEIKNAALAYRIKPTKTGILKFYGSYSVSDLSLRVPNPDSLNYPNYFGLNNNNTYLNTSYKDIIGENLTLFSGFSYAYNIDDINYNTNLIKGKANLLQVKSFLTKGIDDVYITAGGEFHNQKYDDSFNTNNLILRENYAAAFIETDAFLSENIALRGGIRGENSDILNQINLAIRTSLAVKTGENSQISVAYGDFYQTPEREFLRITTNLDYEKATHYIANYQVLGARQTFRIEGYYKKYDNLIKQEGFLLTNRGDGYARGIDIFWRDKSTFTNVDYSVSYSYLETERNYRNFPTTATPTFAPKHSLSIVYKQYLQSLASSVGVTYQYSSGRPYFNPNSSLFLGDKTPDYHNISFSWSYLTSLYNNFTVFYLSIENIFAIENIFTYRFSRDGTTRLPVTSSIPRSIFLGVFMSINELGAF